LHRSLKREILSPNVQDVRRGVRAGKVHLHFFDIVHVTVRRVDSLDASEDEWGTVTIAVEGKLAKVVFGDPAFGRRRHQLGSEMVVCVLDLA
jgi:hypothetical protein